MNNETTPPFTSERDKAAEAYATAEGRVLFDGTTDCIADAFRAGADWGHARASEEARKALAQRNGARDYDAEIGDANVYRATIKRLEAKLAASQAREEGLRAAIEKLLPKITAWDGPISLIEDVERALAAGSTNG